MHLQLPKHKHSLEINTEETMPIALVEVRATPQAQRKESI